MAKPQIGVIIYTHNRVDDAQINMEIIRNVWKDSKLFSAIAIIHTYNGKKSWYPKKYLEDDLIRTKNAGHFQGAADLIDAGISYLQRRYPKIRYAVVLAADTWCTSPRYIRSIIDRMAREKKTWATCPWGLPSQFKLDDVGMATDFFVVDVQWAKRFGFFPLRYASFARQFGTFLAYLRKGLNISVEKLAFARFADASFRQHRENVRRKELLEQQILILKERVPVHTGINKKGYWIRRFVWQKIGLFTHHDPRSKVEALRSIKGWRGKYLSKFMNKKDYQYLYQRSTRLSYD